MAFCPPPHGGVEAGKRAEGKGTAQMHCKEKHKRAPEPKEGTTPRQCSSTPGWLWTRLRNTKVTISRWWMDFAVKQREKECIVFHSMLRVAVMGS